MGGGRGWFDRLNAEIAGDKGGGGVEVIVG